MREIQQVLAELANRNVRLFLAPGDALRYEAPASALTERDRQRLKRLKEDVILFLKAKDAAAFPPLQPADGPETPSYAQRAWWNWVYKTSSNLSFENIGFVLECPGNAMAAIPETLRRTLSRYATLRSAFIMRDGELTATLNLVEKFKVEVESQTSPHAKKLAEDFTRTPLRIDESWLVRAKIFPSSGGPVFLALVFHHMVIDGHSLDLLKAEIKTILAETTGGIPPVHGGIDKPLSFLDYAQAEADWYRGEPGRVLAHYWKGWLAAQSGFQLRLNGKLLEWQPGSNVNHRFKLPAPIREKVLSLAERRGVFEFIVYASVYALALARWSGQTQIPIRCLGNLRDTHAPRHMIGNLVCADPISIHVEDDGHFETLLQTVLEEYSQATMLRLPSLQNFPPHDANPAAESERFTNSIAATINFLPQKAFEAGSPDASVTLDSWKPSIHSSEPEEWPVLLWPIYLRLSGQGSQVAGIFQFNQALLPKDDQTRLMDIFFEALLEVIPD